MSSEITFWWNSPNFLITSVMHLHIVVGFRWLPHQSPDEQSGVWFGLRDWDRVALIDLFVKMLNLEQNLQWPFFCSELRIWNNFVHPTSRSSTTVTVAYATLILWKLHFKSFFFFFFMIPEIVFIGKSPQLIFFPPQEEKKKKLQTLHVKI